MSSQDQTAAQNSQSTDEDVETELVLPWFSSFLSDHGFKVIAIVGAFAIFLALLTTRAEKEISGIKERSANEQIAKAQERAALAEQKAEETRLEALKMERALAPRFFEGQHLASDALKSFAPITARIEFFPVDWETQRAALEISSVLRTAGWSVEVFASVDPLLTVGGVLVQTNAVGPDPDGAKTKSLDAASALVDELNKTKIAARMRGNTPEIPEGSVLVRVGVKPNPALRPEQLTPDESGNIVAGNTATIVIENTKKND